MHTVLCWNLGGNLFSPRMSTHHKIYKKNYKVQFSIINKYNVFLSNFAIKVALLSLEQLLKGVFVIAAPPTMGVGTSEEYGVPLLDDSI